AWGAAGPAPSRYDREKADCRTAHWLGSDGGYGQSIAFSPDLPKVGSAGAPPGGRLEEMMMHKEKQGCH
ncbi:MAG: hypothetical protein MUO63_21445, partial [Desulfobulbaceae bacterium]|nr:hypothetical protein [Desulfobulbaceae bacterium]